jgi:hypothetical protein
VCGVDDDVDGVIIEQEEVERAGVPLSSFNKYWR